MVTYRCKSCGASIPQKDNESLTCPYCGSHKVGPGKKLPGILFKSVLFRKKPFLILVSMAIVLSIVVAIFYLYPHRVNPGEMNALHSKIIIDTSKRIGIDLVHGSAWNGMVEELRKQGLAVTLLETTIKRSMLQKIEVLLIHSYSTAYAKREIDAITDFVKTGGTLVVATLAWSWTYKAYGNKPVETFPLNKLGEKLGYQITGENIGGPIHIDKDLKKYIPKITIKNWWPSKIKFFNDAYTALVRDEHYRILAGSLVYGRGMVVVYGHNAMLAQNPRLLYYFLRK